MVEFKDLTGLSEPLKRLIEVVAEGIGGISKPILTRKNADAKAYEIKAVAEAIAKSQKLLGTVKYDGGEIIIESEQNQNFAELPEADFDRRLISRMAYQEAKRQENIERITQYAAEDFTGNEEMVSERPESNWTARFFRIAEDISTEGMQALWGKVLAGEVKRPGAYSLRTLDVALDKYTIVESDRTRTVYNWLQYFAPEDLEKEFRDTGFSVEGLYSDVAGTPYDPKSNEFAIIAGKTPTGTE
jgi:hypothetical protein